MHLTSFSLSVCVCVLAYFYGESFVKLKKVFQKSYSVQKEFDAQNISMICSVLHHPFQDPQ